MANEFVVKNGLIVNGGTTTITGSLVAPSITGSLFGTASLALTASYVNPLIQDVLITGSLFLTGTGNNLFLIRNQTNTPVLTVSQSGVIILATQSVELAGSAPNGGLYFTSASFYVGLD